jgi:nitrogen regulatory protein P-II 2
MKLILAMIQPERLDAVKKELFEIDVKKMTVLKVKGCGQQGGFSESYRGQVTEINLLDKIQLEIMLNDEFVDGAIDAIVKGAQSGKIGDGKISVLPIERCVRIRTEEKDEEAIG